MKHSEAGILSLCVFGLLGLAVAVAYQYFTTPHTGDPTAAIGLVFCLLGGPPLLGLLGFLLGLAGLFQRDRRRVTAVVGMALHSLALVLMVALFFWAQARGKAEKKAVAAQAQRDAADAADAADEAKWNDVNTELIKKLEASDRLQLIYMAYLAAEESTGHPPSQLGDIKPFVGRGRSWMRKHGGWSSDDNRLTEEQRTEILTSPRDRQQFTIAFSEGGRNSGPNHPGRPLAWEATADSREGRFVVTTQGKTVYMEADEFRKLQGAQGK